jgi:hypothetical protein
MYTYYSISTRARSRSRSAGIARACSECITGNGADIICNACVVVDSSTSQPIMHPCSKTQAAYISPVCTAQEVAPTGGQERPSIAAHGLATPPARLNENSLYHGSSCKCLVECTIPAIDSIERGTSTRDQPIGSRAIPRPRYRNQGNCRDSDEKLASST